MFIQTEPTPNPNALKFLPGRMVAPEGGLAFDGPEAATASPLAEALFGLDGVAGVFFGAEAVSVTRAAEGPSWSEMKAPVLAAVMDHFTSGAPPLFLIEEGEAPEAIRKVVSEDPEIKILVLAAGSGARGPGPLVTAVIKQGAAFAGRKLPVTIVPGELTEKDIEDLA